MMPAVCGRLLCLRLLVATRAPDLRQKMLTDEAAGSPAGDLKSFDDCSEMSTASAKFCASPPGSGTEAIVAGIAPSAANPNVCVVWPLQIQNRRGCREQSRGADGARWRDEKGQPAKGGMAGFTDGFKDCAAARRSEKDRPPGSGARRNRVPLARSPG